MPPLPAANKILKVAWEYGVEFQTNVNIWHIRYDGAGGNQTDLDLLRDDVTAAIQAFLHPLQHVDAVDQAITITDLTSDTALVSGDVPTGAGTHAGGASPANCAAVVSWKIHRRYRGGHPRTYVGAIPLTAYLDERAFTTTYTNLLITRGATFLVDINALVEGVYGNLELGSLSYFSGGAARVTPVFDPITAATANARPDSQRRRLGKVAG